MDRLKQLDEEEKRIATEIGDSFEATEGMQDLRIKDVLGLEFEKPLATVPRASCGIPSGSIWSLLPLYQTVLLPLSATVSFDGKKVYQLNSNKIFKKIYDLEPHDFITLAEKGRVIPYFPYSYTKYDEKFINPFLEPGVPRLTHDRMRLLNRLSYCKSFNSNCKQCDEVATQAKKDLNTLGLTDSDNCVPCLGRLYNSGYRKKFLELAKKQTDKDRMRSIICWADWLSTVRNMDSILYTNCSPILDTMTAFTPLPKSVSLEYIMKGLKVMYDPKIPLDAYLDIVDGKTSRALRNILKKLMADPLAKKYQDRMNAKIYEINREVEKLSKSKLSQIFSATTDVVIYGGSRFVEHQSNKIVSLPGKELKKVGEWISEKAMDIEGKMVGRDWEIAQLYRVRCKLDKCEQAPSNIH